MHILSCIYLYESTYTNSKGFMCLYIEREKDTHALQEKYYQFTYNNPKCLRLIAFCSSQKTRFLQKTFRNIGNSISYHM